MSQPTVLPLDVIRSVLDATGATGEPRWLEAWRRAMLDMLGNTAAGACDPIKKKVLSHLGRVDDIGYRLSLSSSVEAARLFVDSVMALHGDALRQAFRATSGRRTSGDIRRHLSYLVDNYRGRLAASVAIMPPEADLLAATSDALARQARALSTRAAPEHCVLDALLLAAFFRSSRLKTFADNWGALSPIENQRLYARSLFTRLVPTASDTGAVDQAPIIPTVPVTRITPRVTLKNSLNSLVANELAQIHAGTGAMHRFVSPRRAYPLPDGFLAPSPTLVNYRDLVYRQYEFSCVAHLMIAAVEQTLRSIAQKAGVPHMKGTSAPHGVHHWLGKLGLSSRTVDAVRVLYDPAAGGFRNRIAHGSLIDIDCKRYELLAAQSAPMRLLTGSDPYLPGNIVAICADALSRVDLEAGSLGLSAADYGWMTLLAPTADDVGFAASLSTGIDSADPIAWHRQLSSFLTSFCPTLGRLFFLGAFGLISSARPASVIELTYLLLSMEAIFRISGQVLGFPVLQLEVLPSETRAQYLMLDANGFLSPPFLGRILDLVPIGTPRQNAARCVNLAVKMRNALAHGALPDLSDADCRALGRVVINTIDLLKSVTLHHMIKEAAYFIHVKKRLIEPTPQEEWDLAETELLETLHQEAEKKRVLVL